MNKYQKVIAQIAKDDKSKGHSESFREIRNDYRSALKDDVFEDLLGFKRFNKRLSI